MKKVFLTLGQVIVTIILITSFAKCKNETKPANQKIASEIILATDLKSEKKIRKPVVFITGIDGKNDAFYTNARTFFNNKNYEIIDNQYSVEEIMNWLNTNENGSEYGEIHIVNKSNPFQGMNLETTIHGEKVTENSLNKKIVAHALPKSQNGISSKTKIIFHANGVGENEDLVANLKTVFSAEETPKILASKYTSIFNSPFSNHHLAKAYYVFYPTAKSPGKTDLSKEIAKKYPGEKEIDWFDALNNEEERYVGEAYTTNYNVPVNFELDYTLSDNEVPVLKNKSEIINFILQEQDLVSKMEAINIPLDKFRWKATINKNTLKIKGITTVLCVLKPIIKPFGDLEHVEPKIDNARLYSTN